jgi:hypothetical protein
MSVKGFKGFNSKLQCTPNGKVFQYEIGKEYETDRAKACQEGFHFCENPMDVFGYYPPADSRYCEVEGDGEIDRDNDDSKVAVSKIKIATEVGIKGIVEGGVKFIFERINWKDNKQSNNKERSAATNTGYQSAATNTGYRSAATNTGYQSAATNTGDQSAATNTGDRSAATNTGDRSAATNTGDQSAASVEGKESVAFAMGIESKAKGALGCWIVLAEWYHDEDCNWHIKHVKSAAVDGESIKADTWYILKNGEFIEA